MLTGCGDKLIGDDLVSSVLQHNGPLASFSEHFSADFCPAVPGASERMNSFNKQLCLINKIWLSK